MTTKGTPKEPRGNPQGTLREPREDPERIPKEPRGNPQGTPSKHLQTLKTMMYI